MIIHQGMIIVRIGFNILQYVAIVFHIVRTVVIGLTLLSASFSLCNIMDKILFSGNLHGKCLLSV